MTYESVRLGHSRIAISRILGILAAAAVVLVALPSRAVTLTPLATFGGGDGWLSPAENGYGFLGTANNERGLAYGNGHLYVVSRSGGTNIRILDAATGVDGSGNDLGSLSTTGITGGTFTVNMVSVGGDGVIYVGNLQTATNTGGGAFYKVYKWANEAATPTVAYSGDSGLAGARIGDDLAAIGSGSATRLIAGYGTNASNLAGSNGYSIIDPTAGTATAVGIASTPPNLGDFRLGVTFTDASHVIGTQGSGTYSYTSYAGSTGTLLATATLSTPGGSTAERFLAYTVLNGTPLLAVQSSGDAHVAVYSVADPANPVFLVTANATTGALAANGNATGDIAWGPATLNQDGSASQILYAMRTNSGIQAFTFTLGPPVVSGDYNGNGVVDAADYAVWRKNNGLTGGATVAQGDGTGDGNVDQADYDFWRARFGNISGSGSGSLAGAAVPEPSSLAILFLAVVGCLMRRGRRCGIGS